MNPRTTGGLNARRKEEARRVWTLDPKVFGAKG